MGDPQEVLLCLHPKRRAHTPSAGPSTLSASGFRVTTLLRDEDGRDGGVVLPPGTGPKNTHLSYTGAPPHLQVRSLGTKGGRTPIPKETLILIFGCSKGDITTPETDHRTEPLFPVKTRQTSYSGDVPSVPHTLLSGPNDGPSRLRGTCGSTVNDSCEFRH